MGAKPSSDTLASSPEGRASFSPEATRRASVADATIRDRSVLGFVLGFAALAHIVPSGSRGAYPPYPREAGPRLFDDAPTPLTARRRSASS